MKKVGLFFGSFNPIHVGHLIIANYMAESSELDEIWFVISPQNPFKAKKSLLDKTHRLYMVNIAVEENYQLRSCDIEFKMPIPSYTVDTLVHLREKYPTTAFSLIMGSDNLNSLHKWKNYEQILLHHDIYIYPRPGSVTDTSNPLEAHNRIHLLQVPMLEISASFIRKSLKDGKSIRYMVTEPVRKYLEEMQFYT